MKLEAVTVCVDYADFLAEAARHNRHLFERWVIVTGPDDKATIELCRKFDLQCLVSGEVAGGNFNKGRAISLGLHQLSTECWVCHLDADIVLPSTTLGMLQVADLDPSCLYGVDRVCLHSWEEWKRVEASGHLAAQHGYEMVSFVPPGELAPRIRKGPFGYVPIGYFQLWYHTARDGTPRKDYPHTDSDAAHSDIKFALQWDRRRRVLLPEVFAVHLESERVDYGANWKGRKTRPFGPGPGKPDRPAGGY